MMQLTLYTYTKSSSYLGFSVIKISRLVPCDSLQLFMNISLVLHTIQFLFFMSSLSKVTDCPVYCTCAFPLRDGPLMIVGGARAKSEKKI